LDNRKRQVGDMARRGAAVKEILGIVLVERGGLLRDEQIALIREAAALLANHGAMLNELLHDAEDGSMTFEVSPS
jgi:capsular polysaccharide biosynthesis protein